MRTCANSNRFTRDIKVDKRASWFVEIMKFEFLSAKYFCLGIVAIICLTIILSFAPLPFMSYRLEQDGFLLLSDKPIPASTCIILSRTRDVIARSELYRGDMKFRVYLCNKSWLYLFTSCFSRKSKGVHIATTGQIALDMNIITGKNDFVHCLSHEAVHSMTRSHLGWRAIFLPTWVGEGYAEYVANGSWSTREAQSEIQSIKAGVTDDESYRRYRMLVSYAIDVWKIPLDDLYRRAPATKDIMFAMQYQRMAWLMSNIVGNREEYNRFQSPTKKGIVTSISFRYDGE